MSSQLTVTTQSLVSNHYCILGQKKSRLQLSYLRMCTILPSPVSLLSPSLFFSMYLVIFLLLFTNSETDIFVIEEKKNCIFNLYLPYRHCLLAKGAGCYAEGIHDAIFNPFSQFRASYQRLYQLMLSYYLLE